MSLKIGAYVRVSTEEQANIVEGSMDSQQHRIRCYLDLKNHQEKNWGKIIETYIDDGYSAKDTKRPAYQKMIRDLRTGKINLILVTDLSRLSRNIPDFCKLLEELSVYKAKFLSIKEQFDSSTPAGEMMLYNMINLAQFERKQTSERVALNFHSRALRGLSNGGCNIHGYDRDPTNSGKFIVNEDEAIVVRRVFELYLESRSLAETARRLMDEGHRPKVHAKKRARLARDGKWTIYSVRTILKNMSYIGIREINKLNKKEDQDYLKPWQRYQVVQAAWPAIVSIKDFEFVKSALSEGLTIEKQRLSFATKRVFLLSGIIRCEVCGHALMGQTSHGKNKAHRYYGHSKIDKKDKACTVKNLRADDVEKAVLGHLDEILSKSGHLNKIEINMKNFLMVTNVDMKKEKELKENTLHELEMEIDSALKFQFSVDSKSQTAQLVAEKLEKMAEQRKLLKTSLEVVKDRQYASGDARAARLSLEDNLEKFKRGWKKAAPIVQKRFLRRMIDCLIYTTEGIKTFYHMDILEESHNQQNKSKMAEGKNPLAIAFLGLNQILRRALASSNLSVENASDFANGAL
jgi:site-specific DNA recombinase